MKIGTKVRYIGPNLMEHYRPLLGTNDIIGKGLIGKITAKINKELVQFTEPGGLATWIVQTKYLEKMKKEKINPEEDGITHINVYSKAKTPLGRLLTNWAISPFTLPDDGAFQSIEGYWYWIGCTHERREELREQVGYWAKNLGRELGAPDWIETKEFEIKIRKALRAKIEQNPKIADMLRESDLPLKHYYTYGDKVVEPKKGRWVLDELESIRMRLKNEN